MNVPLIVSFDSILGASPALAVLFTGRTTNDPVCGASQDIV